MSRRPWKRFNYLIHRWVGIVLGLVLLAWFVSGIVMMYYPYPVLTESARDSVLDPFFLPAPVLSFPEAVASALQDFRVRGNHVATRPDSTLAGGRLITWRGRPAWQIFHQRGYRIKPYLLVDALTGSVLSPVDSVSGARTTSRTSRCGAYASTTLERRSSTWARRPEGSTPGQTARPGWRPGSAPCPTGSTS